MRKRGSEEEASVALYWDFENLHASLCEARQEGAYSKQDNRFRVQEPLVDIQAVVELAASFGPIAINRAYCNWQYFSRYRDALLQSAVELIQLFPPGGSAKNGADIRLCLDALEDAATEFDVQGLELDWTCLCWDANFRRDGTAWQALQFKGKKWQAVNDVARQAYVANSYRVLLTRSRQGLVVFVPHGASEDATRSPEMYDAIYVFLLDCGFDELGSGQTNVH